MMSNQVPKPKYPKLFPASLRSGATGGAATGLGVEYQTLFAVHKSLELISQFKRGLPDPRPQLVVEPRVIENGSVTRWDMLLEPDAMAWETKVRPKKRDLVEFLKRVKSTISTSARLKFELIYGECSVGLLDGIDTLVRIAKESGEDAGKFQQRCDLERDDKLTEVLAILGGSAFAAGHRIILNPPFPARAIESVISMQLRYIVQPDQASRLHDALFTHFMRAMSGREICVIHALVARLENDGIKFASAGPISLQGMDASLGRCIYLLQHCDEGLPIGVLAALCDVASTVEFEKMLRSSSHVFHEGDFWHVNPLPEIVAHEQGPVLLGKGLAAVLEFIRENRTSPVRYRQVENAISLVHECKTLNPVAAATAFGPLDKLLKRRGRKRDVLEIATITVDCARSANRTQEIAEAEAKALICGHSWVHQRIGQLDDARAFAERSLSLGKDIGYDRNTAFCEKCLGRLERVCAEQSSTDRTRKTFLNTSVERLRKAIAAFTQLAEADTLKRNEYLAEVGDCHSLLGRTLLLAGRTNEAIKSAVLARQLVSDEASKDYMDLLILEGELASASFDYLGADKKFTRALELLDPADWEKSEIAARAYFSRWVNDLELKREVERSQADISAAITIWRASGDHFNVAVAEWRLLEARGEPPTRVKLKLKKESIPVRVAGFHFWRDRTQPQGATTLSQRADLNDRAWKELIADAKRSVAIKNGRW